MAGPEEWGAVPVAESPEQWGAQPVDAEPLAGRNIQAFASQSRESVGSALSGGLNALGDSYVGAVKGLGDTLAAPFQGVDKAIANPDRSLMETLTQPITGFGSFAYHYGTLPMSAIGVAFAPAIDLATWSVSHAMGAAIKGVEVAARAAGADLGPLEKSVPYKDIVEKITPDVAFYMGFMAHKNAPPKPWVKPVEIQPVSGSPNPLLPRLEAAQTGLPHVDAVLDDPTIRSVIENPVIDDSHDIGNSWGGSLPLDNPTTYRDRNFPKTMTVDGVTFDTAEPAVVHENPEAHVIQKLMAAGMEREAALRVAYWEYGNPAEHAWYRAHGMDPAHVEAAMRPILDEIAQRKGTNVPEDLFRDTYPDGDPMKAEAGDVAKPSPEEVARAREIMDKARAEGAQPDLAKARDLGLLEPKEKSPAELAELAKIEEESPSEAAFHAVGAAVTPEGMRGDLPKGHKFGEYDKRGKEWVDKIDAPEDARNAVEKIAQEYDWFPEARGGTASPASRAAVAEAAGIDPRDLDSSWLSEHFDNDAKVAAVIQALRQTNKDFRKASERVKADPTPENAAAAMEAEQRHRHVLEYVMGKRAESGRSLAAWKELLRETERAKASVELRAKEKPTAEGVPGEVPKGVADVVDAAGDLLSNLNNPDKPLGLDKLIKAAEGLVGEPAAPGAAPRPKLPPDLAGLVDSAKDTLRSLKGRAEKQQKGEAELDKFRSELSSLEQGKGSVERTTAAARALIEATKPKPKEPKGEPAEPISPERGKLIGAARKLIEAHDGKLKTPPDMTSPELKSLLETAKVAAGYLKQGRARTELGAFRDVLAKFEAGNGSRAELAEVSRNLLDALDVHAAKPTEPKALVEIDKIISQARKFASEKEATATTALPPDLKAMVEQANSAAAELRAKEQTGLDKLIKGAEKQVSDLLKAKAVRKPTEALPPELQDLVDKAERVVDRFGGIAKGEQAALLLARAGRTAAEQAEIARQVDGLSPAQVARVLAKLRHDTRPGWVFWTVQQMLISGLITHTKYAIVNLATTAIERVIAPMGAALLAKARGQEASLLAPLQSIPAMIRAVPDAFAGVQQAFKTGARVPLESELRLYERGEESPESAGAQVPYGQPQGPNWGIWKKVFNETQLDAAAKKLGIPGRSANSLHTFFKILNENGSAATRAHELAAAEGEKFGTDKFWERYQYHLDNPTDAALRANVEDGYKGTFMEKLGEQSEKFAQFVRNTPFRWVVFFTHIPLNMARAGVEISPLATFNMLGETRMGSALKGELGAPAQNLALSKMAIGTAVGAYFINKTLNGKATGNYPTDPTERRRWAVENIQPNSIEVNGEWISLERLGPPAMVARIAANYAQVMQHYDGDDEGAMMGAGLALILGTGKALADDVGFQTIANLIKVMENPQEAARFAAWQLSSYVMPVSLVTQTASYMDPYQRKADSLLAGLKYHIPVAREGLLPKLDPVYGEPVPNPGHHSILRATAVNIDPVKAEMDRLKYFPTYPDRNINGIKLSDQVYQQFQVLSGSIAKTALERYVQNPGWQNLPPYVQREMLRSGVNAAREAARTIMQVQHQQITIQAIQNKERQISGQQPTKSQKKLAEPALP